MFGLNSGNDLLDDLLVFRDAFGVSFPILVDANDTFGDYWQPGGTSPYPLDYVIDQEGKVAYFKTEYDPAAMIAVVDGLLGLSPDIDTQPESLAFGAVDIGQTAALLLAVANGGQGELAVTGIATGTDEFAANLQTLIVPPGATRSVLVEFSPIAAGARVDTLWLASNDLARPLLPVQLHGIGGDGVAAGDFPPGAVGFSAAPNPFGPAGGPARLRFALPAGGRVWLSVYDARGRLVRELAAGDRVSPGEHTAVWDGRDGRGRALPAGVYFSRLRTETRALTRKLTLLR